MLRAPHLARKLRVIDRYCDDDVRSPKALGCVDCHELALCGGLHARTGAFDCLSYCCGTPGKCDKVCTRNPEFVARVWEVGGFPFDNVPRGSEFASRQLPFTIPVLYGRARRTTVFAAPAVGLSLYQVTSRSVAEPRFHSREDLCEYFAISPASQIILSGVAFDSPIERWWRLGPQRAALARKLSELGIYAATTPNYSLFSDSPRWDDLHAMKRIAIVWQEMINAGLFTALHVNARTARDLARWTDLVGNRPEIRSLAYEFGTGAGNPSRIGWHVDGLCELAETVKRPLDLIVRGGTARLSQLGSSFSRVSVLDTTTYMKTVKRKRAELATNGELRWIDHPTDPHSSVDSLLCSNFATVDSFVCQRLGVAASAH